MVGQAGNHDGKIKVGLIQVFQDFGHRRLIGKHRVDDAVVVVTAAHGFHAHIELVACAHIAVVHGIVFHNDFLKFAELGMDALRVDRLRRNGKDHVIILQVRFVDAVAM